jgi:hypothetical protein
MRYEFSYNQLYIFHGKAAPYCEFALKSEARRRYIFPLTTKSRFQGDGGG